MIIFHLVCILFATVHDMCLWTRNRQADLNKPRELIYGLQLVLFWVRKRKSRSGRRTTCTYKSTNLTDFDLGYQNAFKGRIATVIDTLHNKYSRELSFLMSLATTNIFLALFVSLLVSFGYLKIASLIVQTEELLGPQKNWLVMY